ncbi:hypothetical protein J3F83DRAFT_436749 [Trichoderma novae-zelandiae]
MPSCPRDPWKMKDGCRGSTPHSVGVVQARKVITRHSGVLLHFVVPKITCYAMIFRCGLILAQHHWYETNRGQGTLRLIACSLGPEAQPSLIGQEDRMSVDADLYHPQSVTGGKRGMERAKHSTAWIFPDRDATLRDSSTLPRLRILRSCIRISHTSDTYACCVPLGEDLGCCRGASRPPSTPPKLEGIGGRCIANTTVTAFVLERCPGITLTVEQCYDILFTKAVELIATACCCQAELGQLLLSPLRFLGKDCWKNASAT